MLERRAFDNKRLLGAFNVDVDNWMDFFTYTDFVDRDGKFQLQMLKYSAFAPLGRSMSYMLREEAFHMGTGNDGLRRIVEAGVIPAWLIQKYLNKWISSSYDLFGTDHSSSAHWAYVWGVKGRYDEPKNEQAPRPRRPERLQPESVSQRSGWFDRALQWLFESRASRSFTRRTSSSIARSGAGRDRSSMRRPASRSDDRAYEAAPEGKHADCGRQEVAAGNHRQREEVDRGKSWSDAIRWPPSARCESRRSICRAAADVDIVTHP